ncbi:male sterility protein-domain-containing protein [Xylariaceae sp. FL0662B]|nr:male sterility protein-domain-containing protein [Xylariaceae sp. FL0662B]
MASLTEDHQRAPRKVINWAEETALPSDILQLQDHAQTVPTGARTVVLTGSTGYLGRALLDCLVRDDRVGKIHCIGIRNVNNRRTELLGLGEVQLWGGDITLPRLGLSEEDARIVFAEADAIIHNGAEVSHMRSYHSLRLSNTLSAAELVKMSMSVGRRIPFHFVSTAQVGVYFAENTRRLALPEMTVSAHPPPNDGSEGYAASKWASERFLERLHEELPQGWSVFVHRPSLIQRPLGSPASDLGYNILHYAAKMKVVPRVTRMRGYLNTVSVGDVARGIVSSLHGTDVALPGVRYRHYFGEEKLPLHDPATAIFGPEGGTKRKELGCIEVVHPKEWAKKARELGMHEGVARWMETVEDRRVQYFPALL